MNELLTEFKGLRLHGMAVAWADLTEQGGSEGLEASRWLIQELLQTEVVDRGMHSVKHQMSVAKFPRHRDLAGFDFEGSAGERKLIHTPAQMSFTERGQNAVFMGGPGTGKIHLAKANGLSGITNRSKRVRFYSTVDLGNLLEQEKA